MYCSTLDDQEIAIVPPRCCPTSQYWLEADPEEPSDISGCTGYALCFGNASGFCPYPYGAPGTSWWDPLCIDDQRSCAPASMIGDPWGDGAYHYWDNKKY